MAMNHLTVEAEDVCCSMLELAANNDLEEFKKWVEKDPSSIDDAGMWYVRQKGSKQVVLEQRTPLMVAATYGSLDVLKYILSLPDVNVNRGYGLDDVTPLHCAASSGSNNAIEIIQMLLAAGAKVEITDEKGNRPRDVLVVSPKFNEQKSTLEKLLSAPSPAPAGAEGVASSSNSPPKKREYPVDPNLPDIRNSMYTTDEFRMFAFKIQPCSRAYSHDWTECPFAHPGENARRRDLRRFCYSCVPCPEFRRGECRKGDNCEYAHGIFEIWLHPAQYRTRMCKDRTNCTRRVCFFAHLQSELRPMFASTGSALPAVSSPQSPTRAVDYGGALYYTGSPRAIVQVVSPTSLRPTMHHWVQPAAPTMLVPFIPPRLMRPVVIARNVVPAEGLTIDVSHRIGAMNRAINVVPSSLDGMYTLESSSPQWHVNHFQQQQQQQGMMSPRSMAPISPSTSRATRPSSVQQFGSVTLHDLGSASSSSSSAAGGSSSSVDLLLQQVDWTIDPEFAKLKNQVVNEEPDVSWVQSLVTESPQETAQGSSASFRPRQVSPSFTARFDGMHLNGHRSQ